MAITTDQLAEAVQRLAALVQQPAQPQSSVELSQTAKGATQVSRRGRVNSRPDIDPNEVSRRYLAGESSKRTAMDLDCSNRTIAQRLHSAGVTLRPQGKIKTYPGGINPRSKHGTPATKAARWRQRNPERARLIQRAGNAVKYALERGLLVRPEQCEECGARGRVQAAHHNYIELLNVRWLCRTCHGQWDRECPKSEFLFTVKAYAASADEAAATAQRVYDAITGKYAPKVEP